MVEGGKYAAYAEKLTITGSMLFGMSKHDLQRRCGGSSSCAAFSDDVPVDPEVAEAEVILMMMMILTDYSI